MNKTKTPTTEKKKREKIGVVVSTKMNKTVVVAVTHMFRHPLYKKSVRRTKRFAVHNEAYDVHVGDRVTIVETKPVSKTKHFLVTGKVTERV